LPVGSPPQRHIFQAPGDVDYVKFVARAGRRYAIRTLELASRVDTRLYLYDSDGQTLLSWNDDDPDNPPASRIVWDCPSDGTYFVKAANLDPQAGGCDMTYAIEIVEATPTPTPTWIPGQRNVFIPFVLQEPPPTPTPTPTWTPTPTATRTPTPTFTPTPSATPTPPYFEGPWEQEPNDDWQHANGPLRAGRDYYGYPNDARDYFSIYQRASGPVTVDLTNHTGRGVQFMLFYQSMGNRVGWRTAPPYHIEYTGPAGWYYVYIYTESGYITTTPYTLRATFPQAGSIR
jgi:hypothetical protein